MHDTLPQSPGEARIEGITSTSSGIIHISMATMPSSPPLALVASGNEWLARSFESVLSSHGYTVLRAYTTRQALEQTQAARPDAVFIDFGLGAELDGTDLCRLLRGDPFVSPDMPIFMIASGPTSRQERLEALRCGAWEVFWLPFDAEEFLLQLENYVEAKRHADRTRDDNLIDPFTGLYNVKGLLRRVRELGAIALRNNHALACIVFGPDDTMESGGAKGEDKEAPFLTERAAQIFKETCRAGDSIGRLGQSEFAVLAPDTDPAGAIALARRLTAAAEANRWEDGDPDPIRTRAGLYAVPDFSAASIHPVEMLVRATTALRRSRAEPSRERIQSFEPDGSISFS
jgi:diguanylate cyclase (GGDEF)-like protein